MRDNEIIEHGIIFIWIAIVFGSEIRAFKTYSEDDEHDGLIYHVLYNGELTTETQVGCIPGSCPEMH
jgi:hypothetical protein